MKNRITELSATQGDQACSCGYPFAHRTRDVAVSKRRKRNGYYTILRHFDCILCGPSVIRAEVIELDETDPWEKRKG